MNSNYFQVGHFAESFKTKYTPTYHVLHSKKFRGAFRTLFLSNMRPAAVTSVSLPSLIDLVTYM
jgi:hypothetical protein